MSKIIFVRDCLDRGSGSNTATLCVANMLRTKHEFEFVFIYGDQVAEEYLNEFKSIKVLDHFYKSRIERKLKLYTTTLFSLYKTLKKEKPDVVISFGCTSVTVLCILKLFLSYKLVISERRDPSSTQGFSDKIRYFCNNFADRMVFQITGARDFFKKSIRDKSVIIPNPIDIPKECWDINKTDLSIVSVGRMELEQKRQDLLIKSFKKVLEKYPEVKLYFCGDGADLEKTKQLVFDLGLQDNVVFLGRVSEVRKELLKHRLFVIPSDFEGISNAMLEAMSIGMPVIATDCSPGGARFILEDNKYGIVVPRGDIDAMADAIIRLLDNKEECISYGNNGRDSLQRFSYDKIQKLWLDAVIL